MNDEQPINPRISEIATAARQAGIAEHAIREVILDTAPRVRWNDRNELSILDSQGKPLASSSLADFFRGAFRSERPEYYTAGAAPNLLSKRFG